MRRIVVAAVLVAIGGVALAQNQTPVPSIPVPITEPERAAILEMCETAQWAWKRRFDGFCEYLKTKFDAAAKAAEASKASDNPPAEPAK